MTNDTSINDKPMYGVWIPAQGWIKGKDSKPYASFSKDIANEVAQRVGKGARAYSIDIALVDLEEFLLEMEKNNLFSVWVSRLFTKAKSESR